tara:strand:- start:390 stop:860 length:471 start_codon:yes stop_codon:yes gene_type:complete
MEDIKNIESAKARGETLRKSIANKRRNKKYTPGFIEMAVTFLNKTPAEAGLFDASPRSAKGRAAAKKLKDDIRDAGTKRNIQEVISRSEKAQKKIDDAKSKGIDKPKGDKKYNVGVSKGGVPFKEAFAHFRKKGAKTFTWNGKKYTTELAKPKGKK